MAGLTITTNPAALSFLFTEALYAPAEALKTVPPAETDAPLMAEPVAKEREEVFDYLGENRRFILIPVNYPDETYLPTEEKDYFETTLGAVRLNKEDVALQTGNTKRREKG